MDYLSNGITQTEFSEWLQTTDVFEKDIECAQPSSQATSPLKELTKCQHKRKSSFEYDGGEMFGIDAETALRATEMEPPVSDLHYTNNYSASSSITSTSSKPRSLSCTSTMRRSNHEQDIIDLTAANEPIEIDLRPNDGQPPSSAPTGTYRKMLYNDQNRQVISYKRTCMSFDNVFNMDETEFFMQEGQSPASSVAAVSTARNLFKQRTRSCPTSRRTSSMDKSKTSNNFIDKWQKQSHQDSRRTSLPGSMLSKTTDQESLSFNNDVFHTMEEKSSLFLRMMSNGSVVSQGSNELQEAMAQTQQSRQMMMAAAELQDNVQYRSEMTAPPQPLPTLIKGTEAKADTTAWLEAQRNLDVIAREQEWVEAKRNLDLIAREQRIMEEKLAEIQRGDFK